MIVWGIRCRRCRGNLALEHDEYGPYVSCIQCGHIENGQITSLAMTALHRQVTAKVSEKQLPTMSIASRPKVSVG